MPGASARELLNSLTVKLMANPEIAAGLGTALRFTVRGEGGGVFILRCRAPVQLSDGDGAADAEVAVTRADLEAIIERRENPQALYIAGRLMLSGNREVLLKLVHLW